MAKVTIGIPTYNQAVFIEEAVRSALSQTYRDIEVIVADDGSTDGTREILACFFSDRRFRYVCNEKNLGRTGNYRHLLNNLATGDWYVNLDGDDYFTDRAFIEKAMNLVAMSPGIIAVFADCELLDQVKNIRRYFCSCYPDGQIVEGTTFLQDILSLKAQTTHLSTVFKRSKALEIGFYSYDILSSDFESVYRLATHGKMGYVKTVAGVWRKHGKNTVTLKSINDSIKNLVMPDSVASAARIMGVNLSHWNKKMLQMMMTDILIEAYREKNFWRTFVALVKNRPGETLMLLFEVPLIFIKSKWRRKRTLP